MTESQVVNEWIRQGEVKGQLKLLRKHLLELLEFRFPCETSSELAQTINQMDNLSLLEEWYQAAMSVSTFAQFLAVLKG